METGLNRGKCSLRVHGRSICTAPESVIRNTWASVPLECHLSEGQKVWKYTKGWLSKLHRYHILSNKNVITCILKNPWKRKWQPAPVFLPAKSHGQRSLVDYSPWDCKRVRHDLVTKQYNTTTTLIWSGFKKHFGLNLVDRGPGVFLHILRTSERKKLLVPRY